MAEETADQKIARYEYVLDAQMKEIERLRAENERLIAAADAHGVLRSIYLDRDVPQSLRVKAAGLALPTERPKAVAPSMIDEVSRRERWRLFERWSQRREFIIEHHEIPPKGWDAHLEPDTFEEPPESQGMPPVDIVPDPSSPWGHRILTNLLPKPGGRNGNGNDDDTVG